MKLPCPPRALLLILLTGSVALFGGCGHSPQEPTVAQVPDAGAAATVAPDKVGGIPAAADMELGAYPLEIGNIWSYHREFRVRLATPGGAQPPEVFLADVERENTGTEMRMGREYVVQEVRYDEGDGVFSNWIRYRQDRSGLYEADVAVTEPPLPEASADAPRTFAVRNEPMIPRVIRVSADQSALLAAWRRLEAKRAAVASARAAAVAGMQASPPGGIEPGEITRLRYPLHPGASWAIREFPFFGAVVEAREAVMTPAGRIPAARIRIGAEFLGPADRALVWFGRCGELGHRYHLEVEVTDLSGAVVGTLIVDESEDLTGLVLVGPGRF